MLAMSSWFLTQNSDEVAIETEDVIDKHTISLSDESSYSESEQSVNGMYYA